MSTLGDATPAALDHAVDQLVRVLLSLSDHPADRGPVNDAFADFLHRTGPLTDQFRTAVDHNRTGALATALHHVHHACHLLATNHVQQACTELITARVALAGLHTLTGPPLHLD